MIDFHAHFLPGIDDGAYDCLESIEILIESQRQGVDYIFATPHFYPDEDDPDRFIARRDNALRELAEFKKKNFDASPFPKVFLGAEVYYFPGISDTQEMRKLKLGGTNCILVEPPMSPWTDYMLDDIEALSECQGLIPVIAHVDRYVRHLNDDTLFERLSELNVLIQVNADFFLRRAYGNFALDLLSEGKIDMLGSDVHNMTNRVQNIGPAVKKIISNNCAKSLALLNNKGYNILALNNR